jgi:hypothetical protein
MQRGSGEIALARRFQLGFAGLIEIDDCPPGGPL